MDLYYELLEMDYYDVDEAFKGLADENVWKRPAPGLLSIGEQAGHMAYWAALKFASTKGWQKPKDLDLTTLPIQSLLIDHRFRYYTGQIDQPPTPEQLAMTASEVCSELLRVHRESMEIFKVLDPDLDVIAPGYPPGFTYREFLKYATFHLAYHTGQIYSVRHLLGETTPDN